VVFHEGTNQKAQPQRKTFCKKPRRNFSMRTMPHVSQTLGKLDKSQLPICNSIKPKTAPTHAFVSPAVGHLPRTETNHAPVVLFLIDKKVLRRAEDLVDSLVAVFTDVGDTFKGSKNFSDHIFYWLRLSGNKVVVKNKNITVTVRNDFRRLETIFQTLTVETLESGGESFASVGKGRVAVAAYGLENQFVFHEATLAVRDNVGNNFLRLFDRIFVEVVQPSPIGLVIHEFINASSSVAKSNFQVNEVIDVDFNFHFHAYRLQEKVEVVNGFLEIILQARRKQSLDKLDTFR
jgi:hypothetical protein